MFTFYIYVVMLCLLFYIYVVMLCLCLHLCCHAMFIFCIYVVMLCLCFAFMLLCYVYYFAFMLLCYVYFLNLCCYAMVFLLYCSMYSNASLSSKLPENRDSRGCCRCYITELLQSNNSPCSCKFSWRIRKYMYLL